MAYRLLIIPGENETLRALPGQFGDDVEVQVLDNANDALWQVRQSPPAAIIADVELPGMSGLDLAEILPNFGVSTRVVLWSRELDQQAAKQATSLGVHHFLNGPQSPEQLKSAIYEAMSEGQPVPEPEPEPAPPPPPTRLSRAAAIAARGAEQVPERSRPVEPAPAPEPAPDRRRAPEPRREPEPTRRAPEPRREPESTRRAPEPTRRAPEPTRRAPEPPPPAPEPRPAPASRPTRRREGSIVLTADNLPPIRKRMSDLLQEVGAQSIILADRAGMTLTEVGTTTNLPVPTMVLLPMLSTSFSAAGQISQMLRETDFSAVYMQEGKHYDLYCFDVMQRYMMVLLLDNAASATKSGTVLIFGKRAIRDILDYLT